jgi:hypothetical protein
MLIALTGAVVIVLTVTDLMLTTLSVASPRGFVSARLADRLWRGILRVDPPARVLRLLGVTIVSGIVAAWVLLQWTGWALVFIGAGDAVVSSQGGGPVGSGERVYFAGYLVSTMGNGDYTTLGTGWQIASVLASFTGLLTATLAITFLVPVASGVVQRRQVATQIASLGGTPQTILARSWNGTDFSALGQHLSNLYSDLHLLTQRHLAYPVLHYFHSDERYTAVAPMLAVLDDTLLLLQHGAPDPGIDTLTLTATRDAVAELLDLLEGVVIVPTAEPPPAPELRWLERLGAATVDRETFCEVLAREERHRRLLNGFVHSDGWEWTDVHHSPDQ